MFPECCNNLQECCLRFKECCPFAPYAGYAVLGFFTLIFFFLWRRAANKVRVLKAVNRTMERYCNKSCQATLVPPHSHACSGSDNEYDPQELIETVRAMQQSALDTVRIVKADALAKMEQAHQMTLQHVANIVDSLNKVRGDR